MDRVRAVYLACLAVLMVGLGADLWPALQGHAVDAGSLLRILAAMCVTAMLMLIRTHRRL